MVGRLPQKSADRLGGGSILQAFGGFEHGENVADALYHLGR
jgi:hypothetical protein